MYDVIKDPSFQLPWDLLFRWYGESLSGIEYLHSLKPAVLHRDIKTLNCMNSEIRTHLLVLITEENKIKVADFGLSRFSEGDHLTTLGKLRGTYCYTAPEVRAST